MNREQRRHNGGPVPLNVPILGGPMVVGKARSGGPIAGIARKLDEAGTFPVDVVQGPDGQPVTVARRGAFLDAEELLAAFREIVREEIAALKAAP